MLQNFKTSLETILQKILYNFKEDKISEEEMIFCEKYKENHQIKLVVVVTITWEWTFFMCVESNKKKEIPEDTCQPWGKILLW